MISSLWACVGEALVSHIFMQMDGMHKGFNVYPALNGCKTWLQYPSPGMFMHTGLKAFCWWWRFSSNPIITNQLIFTTGWVHGWGRQGSNFPSFGLNSFSSIFGVWMDRTLAQQSSLSSCPTSSLRLSIFISTPSAHFAGLRCCEIDERKPDKLISLLLIHFIVLWTVVSNCTKKWFWN